MKNREIADIFERMGTLLEIRGDNIFKIKAYYKAASNISALAEDIAHLREEERLDQIPGIGKTLRDKIGEYLDTGHLEAYDTLIKEVPETLFEVVHVPSVGPKKAKLFFQELKVKSLADLEKAVNKGKLEGLPGIKEKTIDNIRKGITVVQKGQERMNLGVASRVAEEFVEALKQLKAVKQISVAGSLRRGKETIRDIDILIDATQPQEVMQHFVNLPQVKKINAHGETKSSVLTDKNIQVDLRIVEKDAYGAGLLYFTGSKNFNIKLRQIAQKQNKKINEYGVFKINPKSEKLLASKTEEDCFKALELPYVPPELREDIGEAELFENFKIPRLIEQKNIQGEVHVHSTYSDGRNTIEEMALAAKERGYTYLAISDHSKSLKIARGVTEEDLVLKQKEIERLNKKIKNFRILFGAEVDIDAQGGLDYSDEVLKKFDIVIASIHTGFEQSKDQITERIVKACQNPNVNIIAHPTGVHLGKREAYDLDFKAICEAAVAHNVFLEINAFPIRLDLNSNNVYYARKLGVKFVINTDAHAVEHLNHMRYGVSLARRGWLTQKDVLNTSNVEEMLQRIKK